MYHLTKTSKIANLDPRSSVVQRNFEENQTVILSRECARFSLASTTATISNQQQNQKYIGCICTQIHIHYRSYFLWPFWLSLTSHIALWLAEGFSLGCVINSSIPIYCWYQYLKWPIGGSTSPIPLLMLSQFPQKTTLNSAHLVHFWGSKAFEQFVSLSCLYSFTLLLNLATISISLLTHNDGLIGSSLWQNRVFQQIQRFFITHVAVHGHKFLANNPVTGLRYTPRWVETWIGQLYNIAEQTLVTCDI